VERAVLLHQRFLSHFLPSPWIDQSLYDIGHYYFSKKDYSLALATFRQLLKTYPETDLLERVYFMLGECLFLQKDYPGAIAAYGEVLEARGRTRLEPRSCQDWVMPTITKRITPGPSIIGETSQGIPRLPRKERRPLLACGSLPAETGLPKRSGICGAIERRSGSLSERVEQPGMVLFSEGNVERSQSLFSELLEEFPQYRTTPSLSLMVGQCYLNQNEYSQAKTYLRRLAALNEENKDREKATYLLDGLPLRRSDLMRRETILKAPRSQS